MTKSILDDAIRHHLWATDKVLDVCSDLSAAQLNAPCLGTYGSILSTLRHTVESDRWYIKRFPQGEHLAGIEDDNQMTFAEMRMAMSANGDAWLKLLETDLDPDTELVLRADDGSEFHTTVGVRLAQVVHHGTDHRSQICTALTSIDIEPPEIDVWAYADATGRSRDVAAPG
jgi:uncharacterized damage-inducible protein DinB